MSEPEEKTEQEEEASLNRDGLITILNVAWWACAVLWVATSICVFAGTTWVIPVSLAQAGFWTFVWMMGVNWTLNQQDGKQYSWAEELGTAMANLLFLGAIVWVFSFFGIGMKTDPTGAMIAFFIAISLPYVFLLIAFFVSLGLEKRPEPSQKEPLPEDNGPFDWKNDPVFGSPVG